MRKRPPQWVTRAGFLACGGLSSVLIHWVLTLVGLGTREVNKADPVTIPLERGWGQQFESPGNIPLGQCFRGGADQGQGGILGFCHGQQSFSAKGHLDSAFTAEIQQCVTEWVCLCSNTTLFIKPAEGRLASGCNLPTLNPLV